MAFLPVAKRPAGNTIRKHNREEWRVSATIEEYRLGETPWLVVTGERRSAFRLLGEHQSRGIRAVANDSETIHALQERASSPQTAEFVAAVLEQSRLIYPDQWAELVAMAEGADISLENLVLLNLRGDLAAEEKMGCTDLAFRDGDALFLAHNEDGAPEIEPHCVLLTLKIDGEPAVTAWWYPGFLPSNTFSVNEYGLVWGLNNITVTAPAAAPGRCFVSRALQGCRTITEVADLLRDQPSAGGFAYTIGQIGDRHAIQVETAAGYYACRSTQHAGEEVLWHTNHLRFLPSDLDTTSDNSLTRAKTASTWTIPASEPVDWCLQQLAYAPMPQGVSQNGAGDISSATFATFVVDLSTATVTVAPRDQGATNIPALDLANGRPERQSPHPQQPKELVE